MINLTFFIVPIIIIGVVIVIEFWLIHQKQQLAGTPPNKQYVAVRICSGVGVFAAIGILFLLFIGVVPFASYYLKLLKASFASPVARTEWAVVGGIATGGGLLLAYLDRRIERGNAPPWLKYPQILALGVLGGLVVLPLACGVAGFGLPWLETTIYRHLPGLYTRPLESSVTTHLCAVLQLDIDDKRCQGEAVYTHDFFQNIERYRGASRQQVDEAIGVYRAGCQEWVATISDGIFQHCYYRFANDRVYILISYQDRYPDSFDLTKHSGGRVSTVNLQLDP